MHNSGPANPVIASIAVALEDPFKISKEPFGSFPLTPESEIKHNRPLRTAVLPEVSLPVLSSAVVHLYAYRSFIGLELDEGVSRARLRADVTAAGFTPCMVVLRRERGAGLAHGLAEVEGHVADDDRRLDRLSAKRRAVALGGYAVPLGTP